MKQRCHESVIQKHSSAIQEKKLYIYEKLMKQFIQYMKLQFGSEHNLYQFPLTSSFWLRKAPNTFVVWLFERLMTKKMQLAVKDKSCPTAYELLDRK